MGTHSIDDMVALLRSKNAFDDAFYLQANPDVAKLGLDPLYHYIEFGSYEGRLPTPYFDPNLYRSENPDVATADVEPFFHFVVQGIREGRRVPTPVNLKPRDGNDPPPAARFDAAFYLTANPDVAASGGDPEKHYFEAGEREGRRPNANFDPRYYAQVNPDVATAGMSLFQHFQEVGWKEGRNSTNPAVNWRSFKSDKNILFIGHDAIQAGAETVLLDTVRWFTEHTDLNVTVLLCDVGQLIGEYARYADVYVFHNYSFSIDDRVAPLLGMKWEFVYANTVRSGLVARHFTRALRTRAPLIAHLHELEMVLELFPDDLAALIAAAERFIVVNDRIAEYLHERFRVPRAIVTVEHPFIRSRLRGASDVEGGQAIRDAVRRELAIPREATVIAACGTAYQRKGIDLFVETGIAYCDANPDDDALFMWIGDGEDLSICRKRVDEVGLQERFVFPGHRSDASRVIGAADIFFLSSREDPFPLVCLEAAQYGIPIVHFDRGTGIGDFVQSAGPAAPAGLAVPAFDLRVTAEVIGALIAAPLLRASLGATGRERLFAGFEAEAKLAQLYQILLALRFLKPSVTVIVPNYNHAPYLDARIRSILEQTIKSIQVVILDDASTDASAAVIQKYLGDPRVSFHPNTANSGSPFRQWAKGIALAAADIVWIAESDDVADLELCRNLIGAFADPMVSIATGKSLIIDSRGTVVPGALEPYYDSAETDLFKGNWTRDGIAFTRDHFGAKCTLVNASAMLLRKARLATSMEDVGSYRMCGDWLVYLRMLQNDKIAFSESAISYFRRHDKSAVHLIEGTPIYFRERAAIADWVVAHANPSPIQVRRIVRDLRLEWERFAWKNPDRVFEEFVDAAGLQRQASRRHGTIALYVHGMLFSKGGIERLAAQLANALVRVGYRVVIYCAERTAARPVYPLFEDVRVIGVTIEGSDGVNRLADRLRRDEARLFVPMLSEWLFEAAIEAAGRAGVPVLVSEHNDPWKIEELWWPKEAREKYFSQADRIHLLLPRFLKSLPDALRARAVVIPNGVDLDDPSIRVSDCTARRIICVARFAPQKRLDRLIDAFAVVARARPDWDLVLVGDGPLKEQLELQIAGHGLGGRLLMPGTSDDVPAMLAGSSLFVLPSEFEGFGIVILEAQRAGLPCIAFKACNGPNSLIDHETDGLLVDPSSAPALADAMLDLITDDEKRARFGRAARASVDRYALDKVLDQWVHLIDEMVATVA